MLQPPMSHALGSGFWISRGLRDRNVPLIHHLHTVPGALESLRTGVRGAKKGLSGDMGPGFLAKEFEEPSRCSEV